MLVLFVQAHSFNLCARGKHKVGAGVVCTCPTPSNVPQTTTLWHAFTALDQVQIFLSFWARNETSELPLHVTETLISTYEAAAKINELPQNDLPQSQGRPGVAEALLCATSL
jgi:hypothetical protein